MPYPFLLKIALYYYIDTDLNNKMEEQRLKSLIEALLFVSGRHLSLSEMVELTDAARPEVVASLDALQREYAKRQAGIVIIEVAEGFTMAANPDYTEQLKRLDETVKAGRLTVAAVETAAIIAYKQPITKVEIEQIRGVGVDGPLKTLLDRHLIKIVGRKDAPGRPLCYGTTNDFLLHFGLRNISDLPTLREFTREV